MKTTNVIGKSAVVGGLLLAFGGATLYDGVIKTEEFERNVVTTGGEFSRVSSPGWEFKMPFLQSTKSYPVDLQEEVIPAGSTVTQDKQSIEAVELSLFYQIPEDAVAQIHKDAPGYKSLLRQLAVNVHKEILGNVDTTTLANQRSKINSEMREAMQSEIDRSDLKGIIVTRLQLSKFEWDDQFEKSVRENMQKKNEIDRKKAELEKERIEAERKTTEAKGVADALRAEAEGDRDASQLRATGKAFAIEAEGTARAKALSVQIEAIGDADALVELEKAKNWNGELPQIVAGGGNDGGANLFMDIGALKMRDKAPAPGN